MSYEKECPESVTGCDEGSRTDGKCGWCGRRLWAPAPRPVVFEESALTEAYGRHFDPDYEEYLRPTRVHAVKRRNEGEWE